MSELTNNTYDWDAFNTQDYYQQYLDENGPVTDDCYITPVAVGSLSACMAVNGIRPYSFTEGIDICNGGVPIAAALIAPTLAPDGRLRWMDRGQSQLEQAQLRIKEGRARQLGGWATHQSLMGAANPLWGTAMYHAADIGVADPANIFELEPNSAQIGSTDFGPESLTKNHKEWKEACITYFRAVEKGGIILMRYMIGSKGYKAGQAFPAVEIYPDDVAKLAKRELTQIQNYVYNKPSEPRHKAKAKSSKLPPHTKKAAPRTPSHLKSARSEDDPHTYQGMGVLVGIRI